MADENDTRRAGGRGGRAPREERDETTCRPCRGTGNVISNLGGEPKSVTCPWCGGSGVRDPERDAQEAGVQLRAAAAEG